MWDDGREGERVRDYFASSEGQTRHIFAPFIQKEALQTVVPDSDVDTIVVTRWRTEDLVSGVSDPAIFEYCRENGYTLKIHPQIHAKVYSWDLDTALVGSANLTSSGMALGENLNVEVLVGPLQLPTQTQLKLRKAERNAQLVTREDYEDVLEYLEDTESKTTDYDEIDVGKEPEFLISQLPMTEDPDHLISILANDHPETVDDLTPEQRRCVLHDIATYSLDDLRNKPGDEVQDGLRSRFLAHEFIEMIIDHMDPCMHFGEMKAVVQEECADVPTPSRRELTENIQVLYQWFPKIAPKRFEHDIPGRHSERLCDRSKNDHT